MTPFFNPGPHEYPRIPIYIAGVNRRMAQLAGELCDGFHVHPLKSSRYLREIIVPNIELGLRESDRTRSVIELSSNLFVIPTDAECGAARYEKEVREHIAFYASTPAYRPVFEIHGWGDVADRLSKLASQGQWRDMPRLVTDEILDTFAVCASFAELPGKIMRRYDGLLDRVSYYFGFTPGEQDEKWRQTIAAFKA